MERDGPSVAFGETDDKYLPQHDQHQQLQPHRKYVARQQRRPLELRLTLKVAVGRPSLLGDLNPKATSQTFDWPKNGAHHARLASHAAHHGAGVLPVEAPPPTKRQDGAEDGAHQAPRSDGDVEHPILSNE